MTAAVMSATTTTLPKRHGFSIESLIGKPDRAPTPPSPAVIQPKLESLKHTSPTTSSSTTPSPPPHRHLPPYRASSLLLDSRHSPSAREARDRLLGRDRDSRHSAFTSRDSLSTISHSQLAREAETKRDNDLRQHDLGLLRDRNARERDLVLESMRERERELREMREQREREMATREREMRELRDSRDGRTSNPSVTSRPHSSPRSLSPASPLPHKPPSPETENRLGAWPSEEFKHLLGNFPGGGHLDATSLYQPLRVCNRALASMNGLTSHPGPAGHLGVGVHPQFGHLPINPLLYNLPRDLSPQTHPLLAARYPGFIHPRYPMGPPPGLLFHPYRKPKRNRTAFSPSQLLQLEQAFEKNHYVVGQERKSLAAKLQLTETQVKVWFQNRRTKHKRMKAEEDGGTSESQADGEGGPGTGSDLTSYDNDDDDIICSDEEEEELSVTDNC